MAPSNGDFQGDYDVYDMFAESPEESGEADAYEEHREYMNGLNEMRAHYDSVMTSSGFVGKNQQTYAKFIDDVENYQKFKETKMYDMYPPSEVGTLYYSGGYFTQQDVEDRIVDDFGSMLPAKNFTATDPEELYCDRRTAAWAILNDKNEFANQMNRIYQEYETKFGKPYNHDVDYSSLKNDYLAKHPTDIHQVKYPEAESVLAADRELPWYEPTEEDIEDSYNFE